MSDKNFKNIYPNLRYFMTAGRNVYNTVKHTETKFSERPMHSDVLPDKYSVCNTNTYDSEYNLDVLEGTYPKDLEGNLYICQCLGSPEAFMVGDTNIVKIEFEKDKASLKNRLAWTPAGISKMMLEKTKHRFDYMGLMYASPGLGIYSYTEGMYLLPDGRLAITSDVDRPWILDRDTLKISSPIGKRTDWLPMLSGKAGEIMGNLFAGYSNSHVIYKDAETDEVYFINYQNNLEDKTHKTNLMMWNGYDEFKTWSIVDENGVDIHIKQSIHELIFTKDYIILADTAFVAGTEMMTPWKNAPLPNEKTVVFIIDRRNLKNEESKVTAKTLVIDEPCIHLVAEYENPDDIITVYMLHTPATNTAEILKEYDRDLKGNLFAKNMIGYGTLPVLDVSSIGKYILDMKTCSVSSEYIREKDFTWGPYMYTYMNRQIENFNKQDLYIMFKGFSQKILPKRIYEAYKDVKDRKVPIEEMLNIEVNNSICRIDTEQFKIVDRYIFDDKVLLYTISALENSKDGYLLAGVVSDEGKLSGHEYWLFDGKNLSAGPICKLGHKNLNNSTIFHTVYIPKLEEEKLNNKKISYNVNIYEDYPEEELKKWDKCLLKSFKKVIYPYYNSEDKNHESVKNIVSKFARDRIKENIGKEYLIEERKVENPQEFAEEMVEEIERMLNTTGWKTEVDKENFTVESKSIDGPLSSSGVLVTRAKKIIKSPAKFTFDFLVSPEGYGVIDPACDPNDHKKPPLEEYYWGENKKLEAAIADTNMKGLDETRFVVLNAIDKDRKIFVSKSIIHDKMPGGSRYSNEGKPKDNKERALNTFAIKIEELDSKTCIVYSINYADLCGKTSAAMNNFVNTKIFYKMFYSRLDKALKEKSKYIKIKTI